LEKKSFSNAALSLQESTGNEPGRGGRDNDMRKGLAANAEILRIKFEVSQNIPLLTQHGGMEKAHQLFGKSLSALFKIQ
jgi:hypothetical protein